MTIDLEWQSVRLIINTREIMRQDTIKQLHDNCTTLKQSSNETGNWIAAGSSPKYLNIAECIRSHVKFQNIFLRWYLWTLVQWKLWWRAGENGKGIRAAEKRKVKAGKEEIEGTKGEIENGEIPLCYLVHIPQWLCLIMRRYHTCPFCPTHSW